jgi:hypothetical protein
MSMATDGKSEIVRGSLTRLIQRIGSRARIGAAMFPGDRECAAGKEVLALSLPSDSGGDNAIPPLAQQLLVATNSKPTGGTPTAATLVALTPRLKSFKGPTFVILATDGGPNCNPDKTCDISTCTKNIDSFQSCRPDVPPNCCPGASRDCLDDSATIEAAAALKAANIPTFVVGVPGSAPYSDLLDKVAEAAGTARSSEPRYYRVDSIDEDALTTVLSDIVKKASASCTLPLQFIPLDGAVHVEVDGKSVAADPVNGWTLENKQVVLHGSACATVMDGADLDIRGLDQCREL